MRRDTFILLSTATAITVLLPLKSCSAKPNIENIIARPYSLTLIMSSTLINQIGKKYNELVLNEANKNVLLDKLSDEKYLKKYTSSDITRIQNILKQKILKDYENDNTIILEGWILSKTEARQCALSALINN